MAGFLDDLHGDLAVESQPRSLPLVTTNGQPLLGSTGNQNSRPAAEQLADQLRQLVASGKSIEPVQRGERWAILSGDGQNSLAEFSTQDNALRAASMIGEVRENQTKAMRSEWIALLAGFVLGCRRDVGSCAACQGESPDVISLAGIVRTFQNIRLFPDMTVLKNVLVGLDRSQSHNTFRMALHTPGIRRQEKAMRERVREALKFVDLQGKANGPGEFPRVWRPAPAGNCPCPGDRAEIAPAG